MLYLRYTGKIPGHAIRTGGKGYAFITLPGGAQVLQLQDDQEELFTNLLRYRSRLAPYQPTKAELKDLAAIIKEQEAKAKAEEAAAAERKRQFEISTVAYQLSEARTELKDGIDQCKAIEARAEGLQSKLAELKGEDTKPPKPEKNPKKGN